MSPLPKGLAQACREPYLIPLTLSTPVPSYFLPNMGHHATYYLIHLPSYLLLIDPLEHKLCEGLHPCKCFFPIGATTSRIVPGTQQELKIFAE